MSQLICQNLSVGYDGKMILHDINFEVHAGDYLCIVGENGSGKSTLMKTMLGLLPIIKGKILFGDGLKKNEIGYLPQQTNIQKDFPASVREIVLSGCQAHNVNRLFYSKKEKQIAYDNINKLQINNFKNKSYRQLSGGQQQKVLLARALCATKKILLLDEPVSGLDPKSTQELYTVIKKLNQQEGITIIMISHDITAVKYANKILHVGEKIFFGTKDEYLKSKQSYLFITGKDGEIL